jgi:hypothetical protein
MCMHDGGLSDHPKDEKLKNRIVDDQNVITAGAVPHPWIWDYTFVKN